MKTLKALVSVATFFVLGSAQFVFGQAIGSNVPLTNVGVPGNSGQDAWFPATAWNSTDDQFLIVYRGDHNISNKEEIFGHLVDPATGASIGAQIQISDLVTGNADYDCWYANVTYNSVNNQYLVVWNGESNTNGMVDNEQEIWGQVVNADGTLSGGNFLISNAGGFGSVNDQAVNPDVTYNATDNEYLVVWDATDTDAGTVMGEREIFGQRISATGVQVGVNDFRISEAGPAGVTTITPEFPSVAWNSTNNEYLVVWDADAAVDDEREVYGEILSNTGLTIVSEFLIMDNVTAAADHDNADVVYNSTDNQYLVASDYDGVLDEKYEIHTQLLSSNGTAIGTSNKVSDLVPGQPGFDQTDVALMYNSILNEYFVVWSGESNTMGLINSEYEIFGQRLDANNVEIGGDELISQQGGIGAANFDAFTPAIAYSTTSARALVVWRGDSDIPPYVDNELEIWGQLWEFVNNTAPTITTIADQSICEGASTSALSFTIDDAETTAGNLLVSVSSDNQALIPNGNIVLGGTGANLTVAATPLPGQLGTATISIMVEDEGGLITTETFAVTVNALEDASFSYSAGAYCTTDADPFPTVTGQPNGGFSASPGGMSINVITGMIDLSTSAQGIYTVTYTTTGQCWNTSSVTVTIGGPVTALCQNATVYLDASGNATLTPAQIDGGSSFTCGNLNLSASQTTFDCSNTTTPVTVTLTATDGLGGSGTCSATVTVVDTLAPTVPVLADSSGVCSITVTTPTATDNCQGTITGTTTDPTTINTQGTTVITWVFDDGMGNVSTATQNVIINSIDVSTTLASDGITMVASNQNAGVTYQWIDCATNDPVTGATSFEFTPASGGDYAVIVTENGCSDTSACVNSTVGLNPLEMDEFVMYPNPAETGSFTIQLDAVLKQVSMVDMTGRLVIVDVDLNKKTVDVSGLVTGAYMVRVVTEGGQSRVGTIMVQ